MWNYLEYMEIWKYLNKAVYISCICKLDIINWPYNNIEVLNEIDGIL